MALLGVSGPGSPSIRWQTSCCSHLKAHWRPERICFRALSCSFWLRVFASYWPETTQCSQHGSLFSSEPEIQEQAGESGPPRGGLLCLWPVLEVTFHFCHMQLVTQTTLVQCETRYIRVRITGGVDSRGASWRLVITVTLRDLTICGPAFLRDVVIRKILF